VKVISKLYFYHGTMNSGKSLDLVRSAYNYKERGMTPLILKPSIATRNEDTNKVKSRTGLEFPTITINEDDCIYDILSLYPKPDVILIDEVQFLTTPQINELASIVDTIHIPVLAYGLKTDFRSELFPASKRLLELADEIKEIKSICWCGKAARLNARIVDGQFQIEGEQVLIGAEEKYITLCRKHYMEQKIK
jgi:thymidine kinase